MMFKLAFHEGGVTYKYGFCLESGLEALTKQTENGSLMAKFRCRHRMVIQKWANDFMIETVKPVSTKEKRFRLNP